MDIATRLNQAASRKTQHRPDADDPAWTYWEHRTFNMHRGVLLWRPAFQAPAVENVGSIVRRQVQARYRIGWWRGFAFGVVIDVGNLPLSLDALSSLIDGRNNSRGTWQWTVVLSEKEKAGFAVHMWMEGYLSPVYRDFVSTLEQDGYRISRVRCEKDRTMRLLTKIADLHHTIHTLGLSREAFPEFEDSDARRP